MIMVCGDVHGNTSHMEHLIAVARRNSITKMIQVGDSGFILKNTNAIQHLSNRLTTEGIDLWVLLGNHENYDLWRSDFECTPDDVEIKTPLPRIHHIPRGAVFKLEDIRFMGFGGAVSVDADSRVKYITWWPEEVITEKQVFRVVDNPTKVDVLLTHDMPECPSKMVEWLKACDETIPTRMAAASRCSREGLRLVFDAVNPELVIHGHYHYPYTDMLAGKKIIGLDRDGTGKDSYMFLKKEDLECS